MSGITRIKCPHCQQLFTPDARNATRQRYCSKPACRKHSKAESQRRWLQKPENRDYFCAPEHVQRDQRWRKQNPGYWRKAKRSPVALQDPLIEQLPVNNLNNANPGTAALQDALIMQPAVMVAAGVGTRQVWGRQVWGRPCFHVLLSKKQTAVDQAWLVEPASMPRVRHTIYFSIVSNAADLWQVMQKADEIEVKDFAR